jgi:hypothetical protein
MPGTIEKKALRVGDSTFDRLFFEYAGSSTRRLLTTRPTGD